MPALPVPDPPLADPSGRWELRPWSMPDAQALSTAWQDPEIARWCAVPAEVDARAAARWISAWGDRVEGGIALDLVIVDLVAGTVAGEVGLRRLARPPTAAPGPDAHELGWWVGPAHRGRGVAAAVVAVFGRWAAAAVGPPVVARIPVGNLASGRVATAAGLQRRGTLASGHDLWVFPAVPSGTVGPSCYGRLLTVKRVL